MIIVGLYIGDNCWIVYRRYLLNDVINVYVHWQMLLLNIILILFMGQELYMYMFICDMHECLNAYTLIIDYD